MTYGLVPRLVTSSAGYVEHWDDVEEPRPDVVIVRPVSMQDWAVNTGASVEVARAWLEDYATIRNKALVQVYYLRRTGELTSELEAILRDKDIREFKVPGRLIDVRKHDGQILVQVWGVRPLLAPGPAPISAGRWDYGQLEWPGCPDLITHDQAMHLTPWDVVYVRDSVLARYEGQPGYTVYPESGAVSYGNQWNVSWTERVGRDLVELQLKKLYEGSRPNTVRHWHRHSVPPPSPAVRAVTQNVGTRARRIVYALASLGEAVATVASRFTATSLSAHDVVGLDRGELDYRGWWTADHVEPVTRHIPLALTEDAFLDRCSTLYQLVGEGLSEGALRHLLEDLGVPSGNIDGFGSLKLLEHLIRIAELSKQTGLPPNNENLLNRLEDETEATHIEKLFALYELRKLADHRADTSRPGKMRDALIEFGLDPAAYGGGWGLALDAVYDGVAETLETAARTVMQATSWRRRLRLW